MAMKAPRKTIVSKRQNLRAGNQKFGQYLDTTINLKIDQL